MAKRSLVKLALAVSFFARAEAGFGSFYLPKYITASSKGWDLSTHGHVTTSQKKVRTDRAGAIGMYWGEHITFQLPECPGQDDVLELTIGQAGNVDYSDDDYNVDMDYTIYLYDGGSPALQLLKHGTLIEHYYGRWNSGASNNFFIPLGGVNASSFTIKIDLPIEQIRDEWKYSWQHRESAPEAAAFISTVAAVWTVGEVHAEEQVAIVDFYKHAIAGYGSGAGAGRYTDTSIGDNHECIKGPVLHSTASSEIRNAMYLKFVTGEHLNRFAPRDAYIDQYHPRRCHIALNFSHIVDNMQGPLFMSVPWISLNQQKSSYQGHFFVSHTNVTEHVNDVVWFHDNFDDEKEYEEEAQLTVQIPGEYLKAVLTPSPSATNLTDIGVGTSNSPAHGGNSQAANLPYDYMFRFHGYLSRFGKIQGSGSHATVLDLSRGEFEVFDGAVKTGRVDAPKVSGQFANAGELWMDKRVFPYIEHRDYPSSTHGEVIFAAPISTVPYFLEMTVCYNRGMVWDMTDAITEHIIARGEWEPVAGDESGTTQSFIFIDNVTSGQIRLRMNSTDDYGGGWLLWPYLVVRQAESSGTAVPCMPTTECPVLSGAMPNSGIWILGDQGESCDSACDRIGQKCNACSTQQITLATASGAQEFSDRMSCKRSFCNNATDAIHPSMDSNRFCCWSGGRSKCDAKKTGMKRVCCCGDKCGAPDSSRTCSPPCRFRPGFCDCDINSSVPCAGFSPVLPLAVLMLMFTA